MTEKNYMVPLDGYREPKNVMIFFPEDEANAKKTRVDYQRYRINRPGDFWSKETFTLSTRTGEILERVMVDNVDPETINNDITDAKSKGLFCMITYDTPEEAEWRLLYGEEKVTI